MIEIDFKAAGVWKTTSQPYYKAAGVWQPALQAYIKQAGVWQNAFNYDVTPPNLPLLSLQNIGNKYINIGVRMPQLVHQTDIKRIIIKVTTGSTYISSGVVGGSGYYTQPDVAGSTESFSTVWYNNQGGFTDGRDTSVFVVKKFNPTMPWTNGLTLAPSTKYRVSAWAEDMAGNISPAINAGVTTAKSASSASSVVLKTTRFFPVSAGTGATVAGTFTAGDLYVGTSPDRYGVWNYGDQLINTIPNNATVIRSEITIKRAAVDHGSASSKMYAWYHDVAGAEAGVPITAGHQKEPRQIYNLGSTTVNSTPKGAAVTHDIPDQWDADMRTSLRGIGVYCSSGDLINSQQLLLSPANYAMSGALLVSWEE